MTIRNIPDDIAAAIDRAVSDAGFSSREHFFRGHLAQHFGPDNSATLRISQRFSEIIHGMIALGTDGKLTPRPSVADLARRLDHPDTSRLDAQLRGDMPLPFAEGDRICAMFGVNNRWLDTGESTPFEQTALYRDPITMLREIYEHGLPFQSLHFALSDDESDGAACVFGRSADYRYTLLLQNVAVRGGLGTSGDADLKAFCYLLACVTGIPGQHDYFLERSAQRRHIATTAVIVDRKAYKELVWGRSHPAKYLHAQHPSDWHQYLWDVTTTRKYTLNYIAAHARWTEDMAASGVTSFDGLERHIAEVLKMWQPNDADLASMLRERDNADTRHDFEYYEHIVQLAREHRLSLPATPELQKVRELFYDNGKPRPAWLDPFNIDKPEEPGEINHVVSINARPARLTKRPN